MFSAFQIRWFCFPLSAWYLKLCVPILWKRDNQYYVDGFVEYVFKINATFSSSVLFLFRLIFQRATSVFTRCVWCVDIRHQQCELMNSRLAYYLLTANQATSNITLMCLHMPNIY